MAVFVYILQNEDTGKFYIGSSTNVERRFKEHQRGIVRSTKGWVRKKIVLVQEYPDIDAAERVERKLKTFKSRVIIEKIVKDGKIKLV